MLIFREEAPCSGPFQTYFAPGDLAACLANTIHQPMELRGHNHTGNLPATEVRSKKELHGQAQGEISASSLTPADTHENHNIANASQQTCEPDASNLTGGAASSQGGSPLSLSTNRDLEIFQCPGSDRFADLIASDPCSQAALRLLSGSSDKGMKRSRDCSLASSKTIDEGSHGGRASPRARLTSYVRGNGAVAFA